MSYRKDKFYIDHLPLGCADSGTPKLQIPSQFERSWERKIFFLNWERSGLFLKVKTPNDSVILKESIYSVCKNLIKSKPPLHCVFFFFLEKVIPSDETPEFWLVKPIMTSWIDLERLIPRPANVAYIICRWFYQLTVYTAFRNYFKFWQISWMRERSNSSRVNTICIHINIDGETSRFVNIKANTFVWKRIKTLQYMKIGKSIYCSRLKNELYRRKSMKPTPMHAFLIQYILSCIIAIGNGCWYARCHSHQKLVVNLQLLSFSCSILAQWI